MTPPPLITLYVKNDPIDKIFMCLTLPLMIFSNYFQCGSSFLKESFKMNAHTLRTFGKVWAGPGIMPDHKDPITLDTIIDDQDAEWVPGEITGYLRYKLGDELDDDLDWMLNGRRVMDKCTVCGEEFDLDYEGIDIDDNEMDMGGYPCAHVCRDCDADVKRRAILFQKFT